jgi:hypothetical protein
VAALPSGNAWAVGYTRQAGSKSQALIEHWNGKSWVRVPGAGPRRPNPAGALGSSELTAVAAPSAANASAVGNHAALYILTEPLAEHWSDGWHLVPTPMRR